MRVVGLFRVSTEKQEEHGTSLESQEAAFRAMAEQQGWEVVATFRGCESATQAASDRRVLQQVLQCLREQEVDAIWVIEQSRLTRGDQLEAASLMRELTERGVKVSVNGTIRDPASIDDGFVMAIQSAVDHMESKRIKQRMQRGKRQRASQGKKATAFVRQHGVSYPIRDGNGKVKALGQFPEVALMHKASATLARLEAEFGLTPSSRTRINVAPEPLPDPKGYFAAG